MSTETQETKAPETTGQPPVEQPATTTSTTSQEASQPASTPPSSSETPAPASTEAPSSEKPADQAAPVSTPDAEEYELELPDGSHLSDEQFNAFAAEAGRLGLPKDEAQKLLNSMEASASSVHTQYKSQQENFIKEQREAFNKDPDFIEGPARTKSFESIGRAVAKFGDDDFKKLLNTPGVGDNIHLAKFLKKIGDMVAPDTIEGTGHSGGPVANDTNAWLRQQYPSMVK